MLCTLGGCGDAVLAPPNEAFHQLPLPPTSPLTRGSTRQGLRRHGTQQAKQLTKDDVLGWLLMCPEDEASWVLARMSFGRSHLMRGYQDLRVLDEKEVTDWLCEVRHDCLERILQALCRERAATLEEALSATMSAISTAKKGGLKALDSPALPVAPPAVPPPAPDEQVKLSLGEDTDMDPMSNVAPPKAIISLASLAYFSTEGEPYCEIDVMRSGNLAQTSRVRFQTAPGSAKPGKTYVHTTGELEFKPGDSVAIFQVPLFDDDEWNTTLEFVVELLSEGLVNCQLDMYLTSAKVKVIDNDAFPTNKYRKQILAMDIQSIPGPGLLLEYFKMNYCNHIIRRGTIKMCLANQLENFFFTLKLFMNVYLVDYVLSPERLDEDLIIVQSKEGSLLMLLLATIVPFAITYCLDQRKFTWKVAGTSRNTLQKSLLRKFLNYEEASRRQIDQGDLVMAMTRDAFKVVHDGYMNFLDLLKEVGKIFLILGYLFAAPYVFSRPMRIENILIPFLAFPFLLVSFLMLRVRVTTENFLAMNETQDNFVDYVERTVSSYRIIADYNARSTYVDVFEGVIKKFNSAFTGTSTVLGVNNYFPRWVTVVIVSLYVVVSGQQTISGNMTLGIFLADVQVYTQVGEAWGIIYKVLLEMQTCFPAMARIVRLENLPTDVPHRRKLMAHNRKLTNRLRKEMRQKGKPVNVDDMPITVDNLQISSAGTGGGMNHSGGLRIEQGQLVALVGNRGQGKATLLKVLGSVILPRTDVEDPGFFMPCHLRVLHISLEPMFFRGSLMANLTYGARKNTSDGSTDRVRKILQRLQLGEEVIGLLDSEEDQDWGEVFSHTTRSIINLARALVANPEVVCIHKPTQMFDVRMSQCILNCLWDFVKNKGLESNPDTWSLRRPRTCIFTSCEAVDLAYADSVAHISREHGIRLMHKEDVTAEMMF